ncbi:hypothetical protein PUMCH_001451 [Australozyma saopauloensis]|uniref:Amino acid permease/ SLC12A domain-containing protein n=1 Tax=Australozyma saopauloensis TaxID=291208 RepID=A0AAX4H6U7_9ASCO|nr:hypothetical protein PUMCH_001451 [[Candida] saopauloensis]
MSHHLSPLAVSMLAIGGTIGTGLFFSVSTLLARGPLTTLASMLYVALIVVVVLQTAGELAAKFPETGLICRFQYMFLGRAAGLANSIVYWISWGLTFALELSLVVSIVRFWFPHSDSQNLTIVFVVWATLTAFNLLPVDIYGQIEYWMALVKVLAILVWIVVVMVSLVAQNRFFSVWTDHWPQSFIGGQTSGTRFVVDLVNSLVFLSFLFQSVESVAISMRDIDNPRKLVRQIMRVVFVRIVVFYLVSVFLLSLSIPYLDPKLKLPELQNLLSSPFLIALQNLGYQENWDLLSLFNFVILTAILLAANSNVYFGSRYLQSMVETEANTTRFAFLARTNSKNVPVAAVLSTAAFGAVALLLKFHSISVVFNFLLTCCALAGMLMWCLLSILYVRYSYALEKQCLPWNRYRRYGAMWALASMIVILGCCGLETFYLFSVLSLVGAYMTVAVFLVAYACLGGGYVPLEEIDLGELIFTDAEYGSVCER